MLRNLENILDAYALGVSLYEDVSPIVFFSFKNSPIVLLELNLCMVTKSSF